MKVIVQKHKILLEKEPINEKEINVSYCEFEFDEDITNDFVKEAYFTLEDKTYKQIINNNKCDYPAEILDKSGVVMIGVVAYKVVDENTEIRYNPSPAYFYTLIGSLKTAENSQPITPSEMEQYMQLLEDGLEEVANIDIDLEELEQGTKVIITNRDGQEKEATILNGKDGKDGKDGVDGKDGIDGKDGKDGVDGKDGTNGSDGISLQYNWNGTSLGIKREDESNYDYVNLKGEQGIQGIQGIQGETGQAGRDGYVQYEAGDNISIVDNVISASGGIQTITQDTYVKDLADGMYILQSGAKIYPFGTSTYYYINASGYLFVSTNTSSSKYFTAIIERGQWNYAGISGTAQDVMVRNKTSNQFGTTDDILYLKKCSFIDKAQTISAKKTFSVLPESSVVPTTNDQLVNKKYVDDAITGALSTSY